MRIGWLLILIGFNVFWSASFSAFKDLKNWLTPGQVVTLRYGIAALLLLAWWPFMSGKSPRGADMLRTAMMGLLVFVCAPRLQVMAAQAGQASDMSVLMALEPLVTTATAALLLRERVPAARWLGFVFGMIGVMLLANIWQPDFHLMDLGVKLIFVASFFCKSACSVMGKPLVERHDILKVTTLALLVGLLVNLILDGSSTVAAASQMPMRGWLEIAFLAIISTVVGYVVWFAALRELPVSAVAMTGFTQPFAGAAIAVLLLGEHPHWGQLWGGLAIATGLVLGLGSFKGWASTNSKLVAS